ncbi:hypothetical protein [Thiolapillus sp.]
MKNKSLRIVFMALFVLPAGVLWASEEDDAYFAAMEKMAAEVDANNTEMLVEETKVDVLDRLGELRKVSPTAWATYKKLRPSHKEEVRKAIRADRDLYQVIEMIFSRNTG